MRQIQRFKEEATALVQKAQAREGFWLITPAMPDAGTLIDDCYQFSVAWECGIADTVLFKCMFEGNMLVHVLWLYPLEKHSDL